VVTLIAEHTTVPSKREFFTGILRQLRYVFYSSSSANALSSTFSDLLIQSANEKHSDCILVFIDNAHELKEPEYHWLCDVFNKMDESDITLITLLVSYTSTIVGRPSRKMNTAKSPVVSSMIPFDFTASPRETTFARA
jgi:hypothetical protein